MTRISISPSYLPSNEFAANFSAAVKSAGFEVFNARWSRLQLLRAKVAVLHWPNSFFDPRHVRYGESNLRKMKMAKRLGTKFVWVAHNAVPHEAASASDVAQRFIDQLDGIIHLSEYGKELLASHYAICPKKMDLVTSLGAYNTIKSPMQHLPPNRDRPIRVLNLGLIKAYKNIEALISAASTLGSGEIEAKIIGKVIDKNYADTLVKSGVPNVRISALDDLMGSEELESIVDESDLVVLPFSRILNSGSVLFALGRNRPVLAPNSGSLPEVRSRVGQEWLYLYDGELTPDVLRAALCWLRETQRGDAPDLSTFDWNRIGRDIGGFLNNLTTRRTGR